MIAMTHKSLKRFAADTDGATLTELVIVLPTLLLLVLGVVEFGRLGHSEAMAQKATELAARTASVRPAVCEDVPETFEPVTVTSGTPPRFGTLCRVGNVCATPDVPERTCTLAENNATADEIWQTIAPLLPGTATRANVQLRYTHDDRMGFLGGPYTPIVTAELVGLEFQFITPLGALANLATAGGGSEIANSITFPNMSASLPGEDLGQGAGS
jgi:Flp pilus assembly protein TadG